MNVYNAVGRSSGGTPNFSGFNATSADPLAHIQSTLESSVSGDTSALGPMKAIANAIMTGVGRPVATISDGLSRMLPTWMPGSTLAQIDKLQQNFMANHDSDLRNLSNADMTGALSAMKGLSNLLSDDSMANFHLSAGPLQTILQKKQQVGRELSSQLAPTPSPTQTTRPKRHSCRRRKMMSTPGRHKATSASRRMPTRLRTFNNAPMR